MEKSHPECPEQGLLPSGPMTLQCTRQYCSLFAGKALQWRIQVADFEVTKKMEAGNSSFHHPDAQIV
jgi:hypothetical protein